MMILPECFQIIRGLIKLPLLPLIESIPWQQKYIRGYPVPRLTAWFGSGAYRYSGVTNAPSPFSLTLENLRQQLECVTGGKFNSVLANYYRDGQDSVAWHADDEPELGPEPTIASVSVGAERTFKIRQNHSPHRWDTALADGDLLVMRGVSQSRYEHCVPKTQLSVGPRVNLTFRYIS